MAKVRFEADIAMFVFLHLSRVEQRSWRPALAMRAASLADDMTGRSDWRRVFRWRISSGFADGYCGVREQPIADKKQNVFAAERILFASEAKGDESLDKHARGPREQPRRGNVRGEV